MLVATDAIRGIDYGFEFLCVKLDQIFIKGVIQPLRGLIFVATDAIRGNDMIQNIRATAEIKLNNHIALARKFIIELNQQFYRPHDPTPRGVIC